MVKNLHKVKPNTGLVELVKDSEVNFVEITLQLTKRKCDCGGESSNEVCYAWCSSMSPWTIGNMYE